jgi:redox-sensitive bicupin YhaK (pirin superfamily)
VEKLTFETRRDDVHTNNTADNNENENENERITPKNSKNTSNIRLINRIIDSVTTTEGEGFIVHRPFPTNTLSHFDPFLLLDEMGPMDLKPGEAKGAPDHPHKGFETVTYMLSGNFVHKDSHGRSGWLNPGDVQWMTAGSGVIHSEMPSKAMIEKGGTLHGLQLWINLPRKDKSAASSYQEISASKIPIVQIPGGKGQIKVIAGRYNETESKIDTKISIIYLHIILEPGTTIQVPVNPKHNIFAYILSGIASFDEKNNPQAKKGQIVIFEKFGDSIIIKTAPNAKEVLQILLIGGSPLNEPIVRYGPFVMNSKEEIYQAIEDYRSGKLGSIIR